MKDSNTTLIVHVESDNIDTLVGDETDEIIEELFDSFLRKYQRGLEDSMKENKLQERWAINRFS